MAAKDLDNSDIKKQEELEDITTCSICTEVYTDPKALPCIHTFCLKCLRETGVKTNKGPGDGMPCPICRRLFKIPGEGFHGLPKHFFIERLIQVSKVSDPSTLSKQDLCSLCLEDSEEQEGTETPTADTYCIDCKRKLCKECCNEHRKFKATKNHKLVPINEHKADQTTTANQAPSVCEVHEQNILNVYCADCKTVVCAICFIEKHNNHKGSHVNKCVDGFRKQIQKNMEAMAQCISKAQLKKTTLAKMKEEMHRKVESLECDVEMRKDKIKHLIDKHADSFLQVLCSERQSRLKEIQMARDDIDAYLSNLETYNSYCQRIMAKGSAKDICSAHSDLSNRVLELEQQFLPITERGIEDFKFCFRQCQLEELLEEDCGNFFGEIGEVVELKPKKRSKEILLAEKSKETDLLRQENEELRKEKANCKAHVEKLKQELDKHKMTINALQMSNDKLKQKGDVEKTTNYSFETSSGTFLKELNMHKAIVKTLETEAKKLGKELETLKAGAEKRCGYAVPAEKKHRLFPFAATFRYKSDPVFVQTIKTKSSEEGNRCITGLTILDKELFVVHERSSEVEVYDTIKLSFSRRWKLKELNDPADIASCYKNKCLYIFDYKGQGQSNEILRVNPNGKLIKIWSVADDYGIGLSVSDESKVILTVTNKSILIEYSPDGQLLREINLLADAGIRYPLHTIKLANGHFVISHSVGDLHRVCLVSSNGKLKKSFGGECESTTIAQMYDPVHLSVDGNGNVMVIDRAKSRVLLLDSDLQFKREILSNRIHGLRDPTKILLDESNGRLFVSDNEWKNQRIFIFDFE